MRFLNKSRSHINFFILLCLSIYPLITLARETEIPIELQQSILPDDSKSEEEEINALIKEIEGINLGDDKREAEIAATIKKIDEMSLGNTEPRAAKKREEGKEIALIIEEIESLDPLKMSESLSPEFCPKATEMAQVQEAPVLQKEGKDEKSVDETNAGAQEEKNGEIESNEVPTERTKLYTEITGRLTRIVEKLTEIVDFLNQAFAAIAQKNGIATPSVIASEARQSETEKLTYAKEKLEEQNKIDEDKLKALKAAERKLEEEHISKDKEQEAVIASELHVIASEAKQSQETAAEASQNTSSAAESALQATREEIAETENKIEENKRRTNSIVNQIISQAITNELEKQSLHNRASKISDKITWYLQIAGKISDESEKEDVVELLESAKSKIVDILTVIAVFENLSAEQIDRVKNSLNEVDDKVGSIEKYFKAVEKLEEDSRKKV